MANWTIKNVRIAGVSAVFPKNIIKTEDFDFFTKEEAEIFNDTVGIKQRRIAPENICASDMCKEAGENLIAELGWEKESIEVLIFESVTGDYKTPPTSCILQNRMGLSENCFCLDMPMGCCGYIYSIAVGGNLVQTGNVKRALLLIGDTAQRMGSPKDKSRMPLFGDCGTAVALEYDIQASPIEVEIQTLGKDYEALITPHGGFRNPATPVSFQYEDFGNGIVRAPIHSLIKGMDVYAFAISRPPKSMKEFIKRNNIDIESDIDYVLIHQANKLIVDRLVKKLKFPSDKVPYNLEEYGNLGGASIPALMVTRLREELSKGKIKLLVSSFGLGLTWGSMCLTTNKIVIPDTSFI